MLVQSTCHSASDDPPSGCPLDVLPSPSIMSSSTADTSSSPRGAAPTWVCLLLCVLAFVDAFDSQILPAAPAQFQYFIQTSTNTTNNEGMYFGVLSSAFITSFSIGILAFGYVSMSMRPFRVISIGVAVLVVAVFLSAISKRANSFELLLVGRVLSGAGEAAFQCVAPAFFTTHASPNAETLWLGVYSVSTTLGAVVGGITSAVAASTIGWDALFALEGLVLMPLLGVCLGGIPRSIDTLDDLTAEAPPCLPHETHHLLDNTTTQTTAPSFVRELVAVCHNTVFVWLCLGSAALAFASSCASSFLTLLLLGLNVFRDETDANVTQGAIGMVTSIGGTLLGSLLLDWTCRGAPQHRRSYFALRQLVVLMPLVVVNMVAGLAGLPNRQWYLVTAAIDGLLTASLPTILMTALLHAVDPSRRALTMGIYTLVVHVLGDVPSPVLMGAIKDAWAPACNSILVDGLVKLNPQCVQDKAGLMQAMLFPVAWDLWAVVCFGVALVVMRRAKQV
ncbi:Aste57867_15238 [Aphanomyces stellatus]|uniref:Aste57867_15238 protein n=1 Tax=Aphanomyces stellatus TaxID=120398 RepID=A0A485L2Y3_9STRA|nr:hypothetical protein As57867_015182 [Aphanomyces stellatus]VFT92047.1 Aste57867_15238 [Aphanomyces stellatus]